LGWRNWTRKFEISWNIYQTDSKSMRCSPCSGTEKKWWTCRLSFWMFLAPGDLIDEKKGIHPWRNAGPWTVIPKWLKMAKVIQQAWWTWCENTSFGLRMPHGEQTKTTNTRRIKNSGWNS
jgi:hypothetical protein